MSENIRIGIAGALGRMGRAVAMVVEARDGAVIGALYDAPGSEGQIADHEGGRGRVLVTPEESFSMCDAIIDFTTPEASVRLARIAIARGGPALIIGSTGLSFEQEAVIAEAAEKVPVVRSASFALGINILMGLVRETAERLGPDAWDIEVFEAHHKRKVDAPSGTALMLGRAAAQGREVKLTDVAVRARDGITGARETGSIGFSVLRGGGIVGDHSVVFAAEDEVITISHSARDRSMFARGALEAAMWSRGQAPGLYDMMDVLGFNN